MRTELSEWMQEALVILSRYKGGATATTVGSELTRRKSSYGPQTSAREGGRTLWALERRGMVRVNYSDFDKKYMWTLTSRGGDWLTMRVVDRVADYGKLAQSSGEAR